MDTPTYPAAESLINALKNFLDATDPANEPETLVQHLEAKLDHYLTHGLVIEYPGVDTPTLQQHRDYKDKIMQRANAIKKMILTDLTPDNAFTDLMAFLVIVYQEEVLFQQCVQQNKGVCPFDSPVFVETVVVEKQP